MSKNNLKKMNKTLKFTIIVIIAVTVFAGIFTWISCGQPWKIESFNEMKHVNYSNYKTQKNEEYFVFIYNPNQSGSMELEASVSNYANYARLNKVKKIYAYNYSIDSNSNIKSDISISDDTKVTRLLVIKDGTVNNKYTDWDDINNALKSEIETSK